MKQIATSLAEDYQAHEDYWLHLRNGVKRAISSTGKADALDAIMDNIPVDRQDNYQIMLDGLKKFWGKKKFDKVTYRKAVWRHSHLKINVSVELFGEYRNKVYLIKLYNHVNDPIRKDEADIMRILFYLDRILGLNIEISGSRCHLDFDLSDRNFELLLSYINNWIKQKEKRSENYFSCNVYEEEYEQWEATFPQNKKSSNELDKSIFQSDVGERIAILVSAFFSRRDLKYR